LQQPVAQGELAHAAVQPGRRSSLPARLRPVRLPT
jgi:hypothetical protein